MKNALIAIDPISKKNKNFEKFCSIVHVFQKKNLLPHASIISVINSSLYTVPLKWYRERKGQYAQEALEYIKRACMGHFNFESVKVLISSSSSNESLIHQIVGYGHRKGSQLLVVSSQERTGLPYWILGSFSETAVLTAKMPVLVIKPHLNPANLFSEVRFLLSIDVASGISKKTLMSVIRMARASKAHIDIVYVIPRSQFMADNLQSKKSKNNARQTLEVISRKLTSAKIKNKVHVLNETKSIAHCLTDFAEKRNAWLTITVNSESQTIKKLLLGSTARRVLSLTKRPFLSLRVE